MHLHYISHALWKYVWDGLKASSSSTQICLHRRVSVMSVGSRVQEMLFSSSASLGNAEYSTLSLKSQKMKKSTKFY